MKNKFKDVFEQGMECELEQNIGFRPDPENAAAYRRLYAEYLLLHDYFGGGGNQVMARFKEERKKCLRMKENRK